MPELKQKLDRFTAAILSQATAEARQALDEVTAKRDKAYRDSEDRILTEVYRYIHGEVERIKSESGREVSRRHLYVMMKKEDASGIHMLKTNHI